MWKPLLALLLDNKPFERSKDPVAPIHTFIYRVILSLISAILLTIFIIIIGMAGYHYLGKLSWIESFLNASMILGGMGEIDPLSANSIKIFASFYALFSGLIFAVIIGVLFAPFIHRFYHRFHLDEE